MMPESERTRLSQEDLIRLQFLSPNRGGVIAEEPYCGVYWIITTCLTGIALGIGFGALAWLVLA